MDLVLFFRRSRRSKSKCHPPQAHNLSLPYAFAEAKIHKSSPVAKPLLGTDQNLFRSSRSCTRSSFWHH